MKNLIVINAQTNGKAKHHELQAMAEAQIENSLNLGWHPRDLILVTNLKFETSATIVRAGLHDGCLTGAKMFALEHLFAEGAIVAGEMWWAHDLDAWQNHPFDEPALRDIGLAEYSRPKFNGGSVFLRYSSQDLIKAVTDHIRSHLMMKEEPAINEVLRRPEHSSRVTVLNSTYNVGCSAYKVRYDRSEKPILVSHFHPTNRLAWLTHVHGQNEARQPSVSRRLAELLARRFNRILPSSNG